MSSYFTSHTHTHTTDLESQLTQLRRGNRRLEEEVAMLEQDLAEKQSTVMSLMNTNAECQQQNAALEMRLSELYSTIAAAFSHLSIPLAGDGHELCCTRDNVIDYLVHLDKLMEEEEGEEIRHRVAEVTSQLKQDISRLGTL